MRMSISMRRCLSFFMSLIILVTMFYVLGSRDKVSAASADYSVSLTAAKTWTRPYTNGYPQFTGITTGLGNYCYEVTGFTVDTTGQYSITVTGGTVYDTMLYLYAGVFNPSDIFSNFIIGDDDSGTLAGTGRDAKIASVTLTAGNRYSLITTSFSQGITGQVSVNVNGPGNIGAPITLNYSAGTGGSISGDESQVILSGASGSAVTAVADANYHFVDWDDGYLIAARTDSNVSTNQSFTANFAIDRHNVSFDSKGGSMVADIPADYDTTIVAPADPTMTGYTFDSWYYVADGTEVQWDFDTNTVTDNVTLYAHWTINSYNVTFDSQGGTPVAGIPADFNALITAPQAPTMQNYSFGGWYKEAACMNAWDFAADKITDNTTLFAKWTINSYTVTFQDWNGSILSQQTVEHGKDAAAPANPVRSGYTFTAWSLPFAAVTGDITTVAGYTLNPTPTPASTPSPTPVTDVLGANLTATPTASPTTGVLGAAKTGETNNQMTIVVGCVLLAAFAAVGTILVIKRKKDKD